jgi:hypothetical protein
MNVIFHETVDKKSLPRSATASTHILCIEVTNASKAAQTMIKTISDTAWISKLSPIGEISYSKTSERTIKKLLSLFKAQKTKKIKSQFGEFLISMSAGEGLKEKLSHTILPISEIWKEKVKKNHGFDFHTISQSNKLSFGEAKYTSKGNPFSDAISQVLDFINKEKDYNDATHLEHIANKPALKNLLDRKRGFCVAFSINSKDHQSVLKSFITADLTKKLSKLCDELFIVGIKHDTI